MKTKPLSPAEMLDIQLWKTINRKRPHNITLAPNRSPSSMPKDEKAVAEIINRRSVAIYFTENGFCAPGKDFVRYDDVVSVEGGAAVLMRRKRDGSNYDQVGLRLRDGSNLYLTDLDQTVFALSRFFEWLTKQRGRRSLYQKAEDLCGSCRGSAGLSTRNLDGYGRD